jgi:single-strand DNA-binding protein
MALNKVLLSGRLVVDPEKKTVGETEVAEFRLAVDRDTKEDKSDFVNCVAWRQPAEYVNNYLTKGAAVNIEGRLVVEQWKDKETGKSREAVKIEVQRIWSISSRPKTDDEQPSLPESTAERDEQPAPQDESGPKRGSKRFF